MNNIIISGRLSSDVEVKTIQGDKPFDIANFSIAVNKYAGKGKENKVSFFYGTASGHSAHFLRDYCGKGDKILLHGELEQQNWINDDGQKRSKILIRVFAVELMQKKKTESETTGSNKPADTFPDDDIPF